MLVVCSKIDRYGRRVGKIIFESRDVCLDLVAEGFAWHYKEYEREQHPEDRRAVHRGEKAWAAKKGLWSILIPPWEYRKGRR